LFNIFQRRLNDALGSSIFGDPTQAVERLQKTYLGRKSGDNITCNYCHESFKTCNMFWKHLVDAGRDAVSDFLAIDLAINHM
jgi:hypothetical protein